MEVKSSMTDSLTTAPPLIRQVNLGKVLAVVSHTAGPVTGTDLMAATGLTRATVHAVANDLIRLGWIRELDPRREAGNQLGRPSRWFEFNERAGYVLGVDMGAHSSTLLLADLRGTTLAVERVPTNPNESLAAQGKQMRAAALKAARTGGVHISDILAIAMGFASRVDSNGNLASNEDYWQASYDARRAALTELTDAAVLAENDANLAALGEGWRGAAHGVDDLAVLLAGERLGVGLVESGRLLHGSQGGAGEMGYLQWVEGVGSAEGIALLARVWGADAVTKRSKTDLKELAGGEPAAVTAEMVFAAAAGGDRIANGILDRLAIRLAKIIATIATIFNPELLVIAGAVSQSTAVLVDRITKQLRELTVTPPRVATSILGEGVVAVGAVKHALDYVRQSALDLDVAPNM